MNNQRVINGPTFCRKNLGDGVGIARVSGEAVHRFGRQADGLAGAQPSHRSADGFVGR